MSSRVCCRFQWADEALCTSHSLQGKKTGARKWVSEMFPGWSGLERERERTHSPSRGVVKFVHGVTVGEVSF